MTRVAVVTGGAGKVGRRLARSFADDGYVVHVVDNAEEARDVAGEVGGVAHVIDMTDDSAAEQLASLSSVDVLVNGVGAWPLVPWNDLTPGLWRKSVDINLTSAYLASWNCRQALRSSSGAIVNISSAVAFKGQAEMVHYATAKAGLIGMTRALARAMGPDGVRVNAVAPGLLSTDEGSSTWSKERRESFRAARALPVDIHVQDVVDAVLHLSSSRARAVTGQTVVIDGGTVMH